jgi:hypothetical protein
VRTAIACVDDLMFLSKIVEASKALAVPLRSLKTPEKVVSACRDAAAEGRETTVFLDLDAASPDPIAIASAVRAATPPLTARLVGFASHVHPEHMQRARAAGVDGVFTRGQFVRELPGLLGD